MSVLLFLCGSEGMVARRGRPFWWRVLIGLAFAMLVVDVLALTLSHSAGRVAAEARSRSLSPGA